MYLHRVCDFGVRLAVAVAIFLAILAAAFILAPMVVQAADGRPPDSPVHAKELQGYLAYKGDVHYLGVEPEDDASEVVLTMVYRMPEEALFYDSVSFTVLAESSLHEYLAGAPISEVTSETVNVLLASPEGTIIQAKVHPEGTGGYTVIVDNGWQTPVSYMMTVHGGAFIDEGGQTLVRTPSQSGRQAAPIIEAQPVQPGAGPANVTEVMALDTVELQDVVSGPLERLGKENHLLSEALGVEVGIEQVDHALHEID